jgi:RimJ/RimL family protein N-acetyltransferase
MSLAETFAWHYEPPYDFYDPGEDPPLNPERFRVVCGEDGRVEAFWYFDQPAPGIVEIGIGLRPDLCGRRLGEPYMRDEVDYARREWSPHTFRLSVASWNTRAITLYERLGFRDTGEREVRTFEKFGVHEFMWMEMSA